MTTALQDAGPLDGIPILFRLHVQRVALARIVGFVTSFLDSSTGWWAILQLLCSQGWKKIARGTSKKCKQNLLFELTPLSVVILVIPKSVIISDF